METSPQKPQVNNTFFQYADETDFLRTDNIIGAILKRNW